DSQRERTSSREGAAANQLPRLPLFLATNQGELVLLGDEHRGEVELECLRDEAGWTWIHKLSMAEYADLYVERLGAERLYPLLRRNLKMVDEPCPGREMIEHLLRKPGRNSTERKRRQGLRRLLEDRPLKITIYSNRTKRAVCEYTRYRIIQDNVGYTALMLAARSKHWQIVQALLKAGARANFVDEDRQTVLHHLAMTDGWFMGEDERVKIVQMLVANGVDVDARDHSGHTAMQVAAIHREWRMVHELISAEASVDRGASDGYTLFHYLAVVSMGRRQDHWVVPTMTTALLQHGLDINRRTDEGNGVTGDTPLNIAARLRDWSTVGVFLKHGADPRLVDAKGLSVLHRLAMNNSRLVPEATLERFVLRPAEPQGVFLSFESRDNLELELVRDLIQKGLDIDLPAPDGKTALDIAASDRWNCLMPVFWVLLANGATINPTTLSGAQRSRALDHLARIPLNPLAFVDTKKLHWLVRCILGYCPHKKFSPTGNDILSCLSPEHRDILKARAATQQCCRMQKEVSEAAITAVESDNLEIAQLLIEHGADVNYRSPGRGRALLSALIQTSDSRLFKEGGLEFLKYILDKGADVNATNESDQTAIHQVFHNPQCGFCGVEMARVIAAVDLLVARGADLLAVDRRGFTPLRSAVHIYRLARGMLEPSVIFHLLQLGTSVFQQTRTAATKWSFDDLNRRISQDAGHPRSMSTYTVKSPCPVVAAAGRGQAEIVRILIECGACSNKTMHQLKHAMELRSRLASEAATFSGLCAPADTWTGVQAVVSEAAGTPRGLKSACRLAIWKSLGCGLGKEEMIGTLGLPTSLQEFLMFRDVIPGPGQGRGSYSRDG
ncbi:hypothetical protein BaRGS_00026223, partial [Batillaria attramentaria]